MIGIFGLFRPNPSEKISLDALAVRHGTGYEIDAPSGTGAALGRCSYRLDLVSSRSSKPDTVRSRGAEVVAIGEIFNGHELLETAQPHPTSDVASVIGRLWEDDRLEALSAANGMFAAAIYEPESHRLILITDRHCGYPLHVWHADGELCFASQLYTILGHPRIPRKPDPEGISQTFVMNRTTGTSTNIANVKPLQAATILEYHDGRVTEKTYWQLQWSRPDCSHREMTHRIAQALRNSMARQTSGDNVGMFMSGGLDSRAILAAAPEGSVSCWTTASFENNPELAIARKMSKYFGAEHHSIIVDPPDILPLLERAVRDTNGLYPASNAFTSFAYPTGESCDHILTGYALDNSLRGLYLPIRYGNVMGSTPRLPVLEKLSSRPTGADILSSIRHFNKPKIVQRIFRSDWLADWWPRHERETDEYLRPWLDSDDPYNAWDGFVFRNVSQHYSFTLVMATRGAANMRIPAFDAELFDLYLKCPPQWRCTGKLVQQALKVLSPETAAMTNANTGFRMDLDPWVELTLLMSRGALRRIGILNRPAVPKKGQSTGSWQDTRILYQEEPDHRKRLLDIRNRLDSISFGVLSSDGVAECIDKHLNGEEDNTKILRYLMTYDAWVNDFGINGDV